MNIINEKTENSKRYLPHELHIRENAVKLIEMEIQLVMYVENIIFLGHLFIVGIKNMMGLKNH